jgi:hypothetical protein
MERAMRLEPKGNKVEVPPHPFSALTVLTMSTLDFFFIRERITAL